MSRPDPATAHLTRWQMRRRQRRALTDRVTSLVFGLLAAATIAFGVALYDPSDPQHQTVPSSWSPQPWLPPFATFVKGPAGAQTISGTARR